MFDDIFEGTPKDKFFDILYNANRELCVAEIDKLVKRCVALETLAQDKFQDLDKEVLALIFGEEEKLDSGVKNYYMDMMASILSQNE